MVQFKKLFFVILSCLLLLPLPTYAAGKSNTQIVGGAIITGSLADKLDISVDNSYFFTAEIMNPGDKWESHIYMRNTSGKAIQVSLREITSRLQDTRLLDALRLRITLPDGTIIYDGYYSQTPTPVMDWITIDAGQTLELIIYKEFPSDSGNDLQNTSFDAKWNFEARADEDSSTQDEEPSPSDDTTAPDDDTSHRDNDDNNNPDDFNNQDNDIPTGDQTVIRMWAILLAACVICVSTGFVVIANQEGDEDDEE